MDQRERTEDSEEALRTMMDGRQLSIWTTLPGIIVSFDPDKQTAVVLPAMKALYRDPTGTLKYLTMPLLVDCPVIFPSGGNVVLTFPISQGDDCVVHFACRCIDGWWQSGAVSVPPDFRMHDLSDGFVHVGPRSLPKTLINVSTTKAQLRSKDGTTFVELDPAAQIVTVTAPGGLIINADVTVNGKVTATGIIKSLADVLAQAISLFSHHHGGVTTGGGITGGPA